MLPFILYLNTGVFNQYDAVLKLHTQKTYYKDEGELWRGRTYHALAGCSATTKKILEMMRRDRTIGLVGPYNSMCDKEYWGGSEVGAERLAERIHFRVDPDSLHFIAGTMFWAHPFILRLLQSLNLSRHDFEQEQGQTNLTTAHQLERLIGVFCESAGMKLCEVPEGVSDSEVKITVPNSSIQTKIIPFYLPQFYPIPQNDDWWGKGFTEWTNVTRSKPLFDGHDQPQLPADLGFYDLRLPEVREAQAELAKQYGVHGFCYHYYWFDIGKRILEYPLQEIMRTGKPDLPFCICWANHNWTRRWDGLEQEILLEQTYSMESCRLMMQDWIPMMRDSRYIRYRERPVIVIFCLRHIPNAQPILMMFREMAYKEGVGEIHIAAVNHGTNPSWAFQGPPQAYGVDAYVDMPPLTTKAAYGLVGGIHKDLKNLSSNFKGGIFDYDVEIEYDLERYAKGYERLIHRGLMVGFDNSARRKENQTIYHGSNPGKFRRWLDGIIQQEQQFLQEKESLIFVQAWNEWAEGNALEPTMRYGRGYLEAIRSCLG